MSHLEFLNGKRLLILLISENAVFTSDAQKTTSFTRAFSVWWMHTTTAHQQLKKCQMIRNITAHNFISTFPEEQYVGAWQLLYWSLLKMSHENISRRKRKVFCRNYRCTKPPPISCQSRGRQLRLLVYLDNLDSYLFVFFSVFLFIVLKKAVHDSFYNIISLSWTFWTFLLRDCSKATRHDVHERNMRSFLAGYRSLERGTSWLRVQGRGLSGNFKVCVFLV